MVSEAPLGLRYDYVCCFGATTFFRDIFADITTRWHFALLKDIIRDACRFITEQTNN